MLVLSALLIVSSAAACTPSPFDAQSPASTATIGVVHSMSGPHEAPALADVGIYTQYIVHGRVREVLPAQWTTGDGKPPRPGVHQYRHFVVTPLVIDLLAPPADNPALHSTQPIAATGDVVVALPGGTYGSELWYTDPAEEFQIGDELVIGVADTPQGFGDATSPRLARTPRGDGWHAFFTYRVNEHGEAYGGPLPEGVTSMPVSALITATYTQSSALPTPTTRPLPQASPTP